jgi:hypothetical protein
MVESAIAKGAIVSGWFQSNGLAWLEAEHHSVFADVFA